MTITGVPWFRRALPQSQLSRAQTDSLCRSLQGKIGRLRSATNEAPPRRRAENGCDVLAAESLRKPPVGIGRAARMREEEEGVGHGG
jgi:hypothetical protein